MSDQGGLLAGTLCRAVAFVRGEALDEGPILQWHGPELDNELSHGGRDIADHNFPPPPRGGLVIFEGWLEVSHGPDPDVMFVGEWRELTHWEICRMRHAMTPWQ